MPSKKTPAKKSAAKAPVKYPAKRAGKARTGAKPATPAKAKAPVVARGTATAKGVKAAVAQANKKAKAAKVTPAAKPATVRDATVREAMAEAPRETVRGIVCNMIGEQAHTDQEILAAVAKALPEKTINLNIIGACRSEMNHGARFPANATVRDPHVPPAVPYEQVLKIDGVNMLRSERPPKAGKPRKPARGKVNAENDPLAKLGIPAAKRKPARKEAVAA